MADTKALEGLFALIILVGGWLYFSGRLDHLIEMYQQSGLPADESAFIRLNADWKHRWQDAPNDIQREPMPLARNKALCDVPKKVFGWIGHVDYVGTYMTSNQIAFNVALVPSLLLRTEGDFQDEGSKIQRGTPLFDTVSKLTSGQLVTFSGHFIKGDKTCLRETSLTNAGSFTSPEYQFIFTDVALNP